MPPPYRKACAACIKSKRRCDMAVPRCYRCRVRSLECCYPGPRYSQRALPLTSNSPSQTAPSIPTDSLEIALSVPDSVTLSNNVEVTGYETDDLLPPFPDYNLDWQEAMTNIESFSVPDVLTVNDSSRKSVLAGEIYQHRIVYAVQRFKSYPSLLVLHGQLPFIHKRLLEKYLPKPLGDILGLCALYERKSEENQQLVYRTIQQHADQLVEMVRMADSDINILASVQALILLQIIRLFDGDIRQRANAENLQPFLVSSIRRLEQRMQGVEDLGQTMAALLKPHMSDAWETWLLSESIRRTVIMGYSLHGLYFFLKNGWDDSHHEFERLSFLGQGALWCAQSRFAWESAVVKLHAFPIRFATWDCDTVTLQPGDIEELGVIMMALTKGVDQVCHWIGHQLLDKYGLRT